MSFALDLTKFAEKAKGNVEAVVRRTTFDVARGVVMRSPVGNPDNWNSEFKAVGQKLGWFGPGYTGGRFRANWQFGEGAMPAGTVDDADKAGTATLARLQAAILQSQVGGVTYLANNLPYAIPLEHGHSQQAPAGMMRVTLSEYQQYIRDAVAQLSR